MKPANAKHRALFDKLTALADRGVNGEKIAAQKKLDRLKKRFDFSAPVMQEGNLFDGIFQRGSAAWPVYRFEHGEMELGISLKQAIEGACKIRCCFRGLELRAEATAETARRLESIAQTVVGSIGKLWGKFSTVAGISAADSPLFVMGLTDGLLNDRRAVGQVLPSRIVKPFRKVRAGKKSLAVAPGLSINPYSVATKLGEQIRFEVPLEEITAELEQLTPKEIAA